MNNKVFVSFARGN